MKNRHKSHILETASSITEGNFYLKIGLTRRQLALVTRLGREWGFKKAPSATAARQLIMLGLVALPSIIKAWHQVEDYARAEDLNITRALEARAVESLNAPV